MPKEIEKTEEKEKEKTKLKTKKESKKKKQETKPKTHKKLKEDESSKDKEKTVDKKLQDINKDKTEKPEEEKSITKRILIEDKSSLSENKSSKDKKLEISDKKELQKKKGKRERIGVLNIYTTFNNTIMNLTDLSGRSIAKFGGGQSTKQDRLKANPTIAMFVSQRIAEEARDNGITGFYVKIRAKTGQNNPGPGAHAAIKSLTRAGFRILSIMDTTRVPRGGPKKKGGRRGRRP